MPQTPYYVLEFCSFSFYLLSDEITDVHHMHKHLNFLLYFTFFFFEVFVYV